MSKRNKEKPKTKRKEKKKGKVTEVTGKESINLLRIKQHGDEWKKA
jgi:hypothetical protein